MKKIFEIPVYAMSKEKLHKKYLDFANSWNKMHSDVSESVNQHCVEIMTYPQRLWDYNHVVGVIQVSTKKHDIWFKIFLPAKTCKCRYRWRSKQKVLLYDILANGTHFYVNKSMANNQIRETVEDMLKSIVKTYIPTRYYVDLEVFQNLNSVIDYRTIMEEQGE